MPKPLLIIVSGPPCSGKTRLGRWLAEALAIPIFHRDGLKEVLFDSLGWADLEWSQRLGGASYALIYHVTETLLRAGRSLAIESNFDPQFDSVRLRELAARCPYHALQIRCMAEGAVLFERFQQRVARGERHPGHLDHLNIERYEPIVRDGPGARNDFLDLGGERIDIETTDFAALDEQRILAQVRAAVARLEASEREEESDG
jgi:predicted kinase